MPPKSKELKAAIQRRWRQKNLASLLIKNEQWREKNELHIREYYKKNHARIRANAKRRHERLKNNPEYIEQNRAYSRKYVDGLKESAINIYSNGAACCAICGNADMDVLC